MTISKTNFFINNQVLFIGLSSNPKSFSRSVYKDFIKSGIDVTGINKRAFSLNGNRVHADITEITSPPECAYILLNKSNTDSAVEELKGRGIKKILFHSKKTVDTATIRKCQNLGIETVVACPKMMISSMPIHKLHGFIAGIRK